MGADAEDRKTPQYLPSLAALVPCKRAQSPWQAALELQSALADMVCKEEGALLLGRERGADL